MVPVKSKILLNFLLLAKTNEEKLTFLSRFGLSVESQTTSSVDAHVCKKGKKPVRSTITTWTIIKRENPLILRVKNKV